VISHRRKISDLVLQLRQLFLEQPFGLTAGCAAFIAHFQDPGQLAKREPDYQRPPDQTHPVHRIRRI
jgi:hypothetical protein